MMMNLTKEERKIVEFLKNADFITLEAEQGSTKVQLKVSGKLHKSFRHNVALNFQELFRESS